MKPPLARPGEVIDALSSWTDGEEKSILLRTREMEVLRLHLARGARIPTHEAQGEVMILCIQGHTRVTAQGNQHELNSGQMLCLLIHEPFELFGLEESSLLITVLSARQGVASPLIGHE